MADPPKKRGRPEAAAEDEAAASSFYTDAQDKSLASNLFRYRRRIADLASSLHDTRSANAGLVDTVAALDRVLSQVRLGSCAAYPPATWWGLTGSPPPRVQVEHSADALCSTLPAAVKGDLSTGLAGLQHAGSQPRLPPETASQLGAPWAIVAEASGLRAASEITTLTALLSTVDAALGSVHDAGEPSWQPPHPGAPPGLPSGGSSRSGGTPHASAPARAVEDGAADAVTAAALKRASDAVSVSLTSRLHRLLAYGGALSKAVSRVAPTGTGSNAAVEGLERQRRAAADTATALWDALAVRSRELGEERARGVRLEEEAHQAVRTLERLRVSRPELDGEIRKLLPGLATRVLQAAASVVDGGGASFAAFSSGPAGDLCSGMAVDVEEGGGGDATSKLSSAGLTRSGSINAGRAGGGMETGFPLPSLGGEGDVSMGGEGSSGTLLLPPSALRLHMSFAGGASGSSAPTPTPTPPVLASSPSASHSGVGYDENGGATASSSAPARGEGVVDWAGEVDHMRGSLQDARLEVNALQDRLGELTAAKEVSAANEEATCTRAFTLERELSVVRAGVGSDAVVKGHAAYSLLFAQWEAEARKAAGSAAQVAAMQGRLDSAHEALSAERGRCADLLHAAGSVAQGGSAHVAALDAQIVKFQGEIIKALQERDEALVKAARSAAEVEACSAHANTVREALASVDEWKEQYAALHAALQARHDAASAAQPSMDEQIASITAERDGMLAALADVSSAFESSKTRNDGLLDVLREKDGHIARLAAEKQRLIVEKALLVSERDSKDTAIADLIGARTSLEAALAAHERTLLDARGAVDLAKEGERAAQREAALAKERSLDGSAGKAVADMRGQADAAREVAARSQGEAATCFTRMEAMSADLNRTREELAVLKAKVAKKDEKLAALKGDVERERERASTSTRDRERYVASTPGGDASVLAHLKKIVFCHLCKEGQRDTVLSRCGHVFCHACVDHRIRDRSRKCPSCNLVFAESDVKKLHFTT